MSALHRPSRERISPLRTNQRIGFALLSTDIVAKRFWTLEQRTFSRARAESPSGNSSPSSLEFSVQRQLVACHRQCYTSLPGSQKLVLWSG
jgi:hypothetical protein